MSANSGSLGCTCYRLRQVTRLVSRAYDAFLAPCGISIGQFGMLETLKRMDGESISRVAHVLQMDRTTLTRNLAPLKKMGLIALQTGSDKRERTLSLTIAGKRALAFAEPKWHAAQKSLEQQLGQAKVKLLNDVLDGTLSHLGGDPCQ